MTSADETGAEAGLPLRAKVASTVSRTAAALSRAAGRGDGSVIGGWLGLIMLFNVWVLIWPNQKKILGIVPATDEEKAKARRVAFLASRTNVMLSMPMLFFMVASGGIFRRAFFG